MDQINKIRTLSLWIFILPIVVLNLCLFITINSHLLDNTIFTVDWNGRSSFTIPYIDGGLSISRTARTYPTYLLFKPCMIITGILLFKYWIKTNELMQNHNNQVKKNTFFTFGILSAIFLICHSILLGTSFDFDLYKFFRRIVLVFFIIFEVIAQTLFVIQLYKNKNKISKIINERILYLKIVLVSILCIVAVASLPILTSSGNTEFKHILEWNYFIGIMLFYFLTFCFWRKKKKT